MLLIKYEITYIHYTLSEVCQDKEIILDTQFVDCEISRYFCKHGAGEESSS